MLASSFFFLLDSDQVCEKIPPISKLCEMATTANWSKLEKGDMDVF
jgi:hypothetical protein